MARIGKVTDPLVIFDSDQANTVVSYAVDAENKVGFEEFGLGRGDNAVDAEKIKATLGNVMYNGSVQLFLHGDGAGNLVVGHRLLSRRKLFTVLTNVVNQRIDLYKPIPIREIVIFGCGAGNTPAGGESYQKAFAEVKKLYTDYRVFETSVKLASPLTWYQFRNGAIKLYDGGRAALPIPNTAIMLDQLVTVAKLQPGRYYYKVRLT